MSKIGLFDLAINIAGAVAMRVPMVKVSNSGYGAFLQTSGRGAQFDHPGKHCAELSPHARPRTARFALSQVRRLVSLRGRLDRRGGCRIECPAQPPIAGRSQVKQCRSREATMSQERISLLGNERTFLLGTSTAPAVPGQFPRPMLVSSEIATSPCRPSWETWRSPKKLTSALGIVQEQPALGWSPIETSAHFPKGKSALATWWLSTPALLHLAAARDGRLRRTLDKTPSKTIEPAT